MGNATCSAVSPADIDEAAQRKRHCRMQRKMIAGELGTLVAEARDVSKPRTRSRNGLLSRIKQLQEQMDQLDRLEHTFERVENIKQTADMVQGVNKLLGNTEGLPTVDAIHDLEDAILDQSESLGEIEKAFNTPWSEGPKLTEDQLQAELDSILGDTKPPNQPPPSEGPPLPVLAQECPSPPKSIQQPPNQPRSGQSQCSPPKISVLEE